MKLWLYKNRTDTSLRDAYLTTIRAVRDKLLDVSSSGYVFTSDRLEGGQLQSKMQHLSCFTGGLLGLTAMYAPDIGPDEVRVFANLAENITNTCHESYASTKTHIGPESFRMDSGVPKPADE